MNSKIFRVNCFYLVTDNMDSGQKMISSRGSHRIIQYYAYYFFLRRSQSPVPQLTSS